ncbi:MAG: TolC family protein [Chitinophagaceae bacterium]|nr:TolC family protein [Chitinophagaceae bacterium]
MSNNIFAQQIISLKEGIDIAVQQYPTIKAKQAVVKASEDLLAASHRDQLPNILLGVQQDYGTINGVNGALYGFPGMVASSGPVLANQNWNAAFGSLYLTNVNWDFFSFGKFKEKNKVAQQALKRDIKDYEQEIFEQKIKVAAAYLNVVASHQITASFEENMLRADSIRLTVITRAKNGLVAGVDSSLANAQYSNARILYTNALDKEKEQKNILANLMGMDNSNFGIDMNFVTKIPAVYTDTVLEQHPVLQYYKSIIDVSNQQVNFLKTQYYPTFTLIGVYQTRGSGFENTYGSDLSAYTQNYWNGVKPVRSNYLIGVGVNWNFMNPIRFSKQVSAQKHFSEALEQSYKAEELNIKTQMRISDDKMNTALSNYNEAPVQVKAAADAYLQKTVMYKNGLATMVDVMQAASALITAETDMDVAYNNIWQALLLKAAAAGNFSLFEDQL